MKKSRRKKMAKSKEERRAEIDRLIKNAKVGFKRFSQEVGVLAKKSEKNIVKASKAGKIQIDLMGLGVQKEKLYYDIGKKVADLNVKNNLKIPELDVFWKKMQKISEETESKKELLDIVRKQEKSE